MQKNKSTLSSLDIRQETTTFRMTEGFFPVAIISKGGIVKSDKGKFKHVYREYGNHYHPRNSENHLQNNGEMYCKSFELKGSYVGTEENPKIYLVGLYQRDHTIY